MVSELTKVCRRRGSESRKVGRRNGEVCVMVWSRGGIYGLFVLVKQRWMEIGMKMQVKYHLLTVSEGVTVKAVCGERKIVCCYGEIEERNIVSSFCCFLC